MSKPKLTEDDFVITAENLRCEVATIKAVTLVESNGKGFLADGRTVILFERHKFHFYSKGKFSKSNPQISSPKAGGYYGGAKEYQRFNKAFELDPIAAMKSCSWGLFQICGFNHAVCGYATVDEFVDAMKQSEGKHLLAFANFVIGNNLADELRRKDWATFARGYNGAAYKKNCYDEKLAAAYKKFSTNR